MDLRLLLSEEGRSDPYRFYAGLHREGEASRLAPPREGYTMAVYGYAAVDSLLRDGRYRQLDAAFLTEYRPRWDDHPAWVTLRNSIFFRDGPEHAQVRRLIGQSFTARRVAMMEPAITRVIHEHLDRLAKLGAGGRPVDFMAEFAYAVPSSIIGDLLGVPEADRAWFKPRVLAISDIFEVDGSTWASVTRADEATEELTEYFIDLVAKRRADPRDDLVSNLARLQSEQPELLSPVELVANLITLFNAGFVTTTHMFGNGLRLLLDRPEAREELLSDPGTASAYVEEILRIEPPSHFVSRYASEPTEIGGVRCEVGDTILVMLGAANHDPRRFADPDAFNPHRDDSDGNAILTFGVGGHFCLGAAMTRMEGVIAFPAIFERFPHMKLVSRPPAPTHLMFRGYDELPVTLG